MFSLSPFNMSAPVFQTHAQIHRDEKISALQVIEGKRILRIILQKHYIVCIVYLVMKTLLMVAL